MERWMPILLVTLQMHRALHQQLLHLIWPRWTIMTICLHLRIRFKRAPLQPIQIRIPCKLSHPFPALWVVRCNSRTRWMTRETSSTSWTKKSSVTLPLWWKANQSTAIKWSWHPDLPTLKHHSHMSFLRKNRGSSTTMMCHMTSLWNSLSISTQIQSRLMPNVSMNFYLWLIDSMYHHSKRDVSRSLHNKSQLKASVRSLNMPIHSTVKDSRKPVYCSLRRTIKRSLQVQGLKI